MKISALVSVFNAMDYLPQCLTAIYPHVEQIVVCDGLIGWFNRDGSVKSNNGQSTDGTVEFVKKFPDPGKKILFGTVIRDHEKDKRQWTVDRASEFGADWMMTVDSDEIYKAEDLVWMRKQLEGLPETRSVWTIHYRFCGDFWHYYTWRGAVWQRMYPKAKLHGLRELLFDRAKCYRDPHKNSMNVSEKEWHKRHWTPAEREIVTYHYSNVCTKEKAHRKKMISVGLNHNMADWDKLQFGAGVSAEEFAKIRNLQEFKGDHPEVMKSHPWMTEPPKWMEEVKKR